MNALKYGFKSWQVHSETETKLVLVPMDNPVLKWRKKSKLNQRTAAISLGISQGQIARIENGTRTCPPELIQKISNGL